MHPSRPLHGLSIALAAAALMAITMGSRSSFGLFVAPLNAATGLGLVTISFAVALNQLLWGVAQPFVGLIADRHGSARVIAVGGLGLATGSALLPFVGSAAELVLALALLAFAGAAAGSNGLLLGEVSRRVSAERRGLAVGIVSAGGSAGQLLLGPTSQGMITAAGWQQAMLGLAALALLALPLALMFRESAGRPALSAQESASMPVRDALTSPAFWLVTGGFFVCGFHVSFLISHMPGVIADCGLPASLAGWWIAVVGLCNVIGSLLAGAAIRRGSMRRVLMVLYGLRALGVATFLALPKTEWVMLGFAAWMGLTYMATLPPTVGLVGKLFGLRHMATLVGVVMLVHQIGAFLGVWLGGIVLTVTGSYDWMWHADIALALLAVAIHLPLIERPATQQSAPSSAPATPAAAAAAVLRPAGAG
ncbi:MAG TPA: MFS transporter [Thauera sp.]|uniref:MFS transporter n=1 Tax=Thauera sp. TaxID=1905334 RepID=UPI002C0B2AFC|nr:MFS transporter [Thauera sp.]HRP23372.1 MFS transporter [Thauera sp.]HRP66706.1 MFS transporter [Thauera sp.]